jgi:hypothetical protein
MEMGIGGAGDGPLGLVAVKARSALGLVGLLTLAGCKSAAQIGAVVTGGVAGAATGNPAVGFAVGVATDAASNYVVRYYARSQQNAEQDVIAQLAGQLPVGDKASWKIEHFVPLNDEHGELQVVSVIGSPLADCRHIMFSVDEGKPPRRHQSWYASDICRNATAWKWATAEPAVPRWGFLQ